MRHFPLQTRLALIVAAAILPFGVFCGVAFQTLYTSQHSQTEESNLSTARAIATAVDAELRRNIAALQTLALTAPFLEPAGAGQPDAVALSHALRAQQPSWRGVLLADRSGAILFSTEPGLAAGSEVLERPSLDAAVRSGKPTVGTLARGRRSDYSFAVRIPIQRDGTVRYVLTAVVGTEVIASVLRSQRMPQGWNVSVFDGSQLRVARAIGDEEWRGGPPGDELRSMLDGLGDKREAVQSVRSVEGIRVKAFVTRLEAAPWTLALGASAAAAENAWVRSMRTIVSGLVASLLLGGLGAWWMARSIIRPMRGLREDAEALGRGEIRPATESVITEINSVSRALSLSASRRASAEAERERLLMRESEARSAAESAERRLEQLVNASVALSSSLEEGSTLSAIARTVVPEMADLCRIDLLDAEGRLQRKLTHHRDPTRGEQIAELVSTRAVSPDVPGSFQWVMRTGKPFVHNADEHGAVQVADPGLREFVQRFEITSACVLPLVARGRTIGAMAVLQAESKRQFTPEDVTLIGELAQRAALALDNALLLADAREAQAQAQQANRAKDEFMAMLGHELRNPLAPIALALQLMVKKDANAFPREREIIGRQVKHLSRMVDDLLDVSRIVSGKIALSLERVDLRDVVARAIELTLPALQLRSEMPRLDLPDSPVFVQGDATRLAQIVCNLLTNSAKFSAPEKPIYVHLRREATSATLQVSDEGVGIPSDLLPRVFDRFVQGEQALHRAAGGLGLGLAISRSLALLHGGDIKAMSDGEGAGASFALLLPCQIEAEDEPAATAGTRVQAGALELLLVDDNRDAVDVLADLLQMEGCKVRTAYSAEEALELLQNHAADAAVFDIGLPGISGYQLARMVRANKSTQQMALMALTGYGRESDRQQALEAGFDDHFAKPAEVHLLLGRIHEVLAARVSVKGGNDTPAGHAS